MNGKQYSNLETQLNLYKDEVGFIRLRGRIGNAEISDDNINFQYY